MLVCMTMLGFPLWNGQVYRFGAMARVSEGHEHTAVQRLDVKEFCNNSFHYRQQTLFFKQR